MSENPTLVLQKKDVCLDLLFSKVALGLDLFDHDTVVVFVALSHMKELFTSLPSHTHAASHPYSIHISEKFGIEMRVLILYPLYSSLYLTISLEVGEI